MFFIYYSSIPTRPVVWSNCCSYVPVSYSSVCDVHEDCPALPMYAAGWGCAPPRQIVARPPRGTQHLSGPNAGVGVSILRSVPQKTEDKVRSRRPNRMCLRLPSWAKRMAQARSLEVRKIRESRASLECSSLTSRRGTGSANDKKKALGCGDAHTPLPAGVHHQPPLDTARPAEGSPSPRAHSTSTSSHSTPLRCLCLSFRAPLAPALLYQQARDLQPFSFAPAELRPKAKGRYTPDTRDCATQKLG